MLNLHYIFCYGIIVSLIQLGLCDTRKYDTTLMHHYRERAKMMFHYAYDKYLTHAYPYDELQPLSCKGQNTWGSFSLTLIDALDTLAVMGNCSEFRRVARKVASEINFNSDINVSVFETNIRVVGGLLSAHLLSKRCEADLEDGWPCSGPLLRQAENVARRLLPAFETKTGMPYGTVNLMYGVPKDETAVTCTAGIGTFLVEFGTLTRLTGDPVFEKVAMNALWALWNHRSEIGLVGNHIDVQDGKWTAMDSGIGAGVDSYFEYLVKGSILFNKPELMHMFKEYQTAFEKYLKHDDWYLWVAMKKGGVSIPMFQSLDAYWPGLQTLTGDLAKAMKTFHNYHQVWRQFGGTPEFYSIPKSDVHKGREGYPLRPELIESAMYLYRATNDTYYFEAGVDILEAIEHIAKTPCGYATVKNVKTHTLADRMESFFLAETTKYLYLLFDPNNFIHADGQRGDIIYTPNGQCVINTGPYIFNTEAHPIDVSAVYCCSAEKKMDDQILWDSEEKLDLLKVLGVNGGTRNDLDLIMDAIGNMDQQSFQRNEKINIHETEKVNENIINSPSLNASDGNNDFNVDQLAITLAPQGGNEGEVKISVSEKPIDYKSKFLDRRVMYCPAQLFTARVAVRGEVFSEEKQEK